MKTFIKILFPLLIVLLIATTVTSDRLEFEFDPNSVDIIIQFAFPQNSESIEIDIRLIALLFCTGVIGLAVFARRRIRYDNDDDKKSQKGPSRTC